MLPFPPVGEVSDDWQETHSTLAPYNDKTQTVAKSNSEFMFTAMEVIFHAVQEWMEEKGGKQDICTDITRDKEKEEDNLDDWHKLKKTH